MLEYARRGVIPGEQIEDCVGWGLETTAATLTRQPEGLVRLPTGSTWLCANSSASRLPGPLGPDSTHPYNPCRLLGDVY